MSDVISIFVKQDSFYTDAVLQHAGCGVQLCLFSGLF